MTRISIFLALPAILNVAAIAQPSSEQAAKDAIRLNEAYEKLQSQDYRQLFQPSGFGTDFEENSQGYREHLAKLEAFEKADRPQIESLLADIRTTYGNDATAIRQTFQEISDAGASIAGDPAYWWEQLQTVANASAETRKKMADELIKLGSTGGQTAQGYERMTVEESFDRAKVYLELAIAYQPDHAEAKECLLAIDGARSERLEGDEKAIDDAEFRPHAKSFQGDADAMQATAVEYLSTRNSGQDGKLLAVRIAGDWHPHDTTLGVTITWGLPVEAAYRMDDDPDSARVVSMNLVTQNENPEPPFQRFAITGERLMRVSNLPGVAAARSGNGFGLMRLPLSLALLVLGFVGAGPLVQRYVPAFKGLVEKVTPYTAIVGVVSLGVGGVALFTSPLSPLQDILPQAGAIALGLAMGLDVLVKRRNQTDVDSPVKAGVEMSVADSAGLKGKAEETLRHAGEAAGQAVARAQDLLIENEGRLRKLIAIQVPLGIGCVALGLLHLVVGGAWLL